MEKRETSFTILNHVFPYAIPSRCDLTYQSNIIHLEWKWNIVPSTIICTTDKVGYTHIKPVLKIIYRYLNHIMRTYNLEENQIHSNSFKLICLYNTCATTSLLLWHPKQKKEIRPFLLTGSIQVVHIPTVGPLWCMFFYNSTYWFFTVYH